MLRQVHSEKVNIYTGKEVFNFIGSLFKLSITIVSNKKPALLCIDWQLMSELFYHFHFT